MAFSDDLPIFSNIVLHIRCPARSSPALALPHEKLWWHCFAGRESSRGKGQGADHSLFSHLLLRHIRARQGR